MVELANGGGLGVETHLQDPLPTPARARLQSYGQGNTYPSYCVLGTSDSGIGLANLRGKTQVSDFLKDSWPESPITAYTEVWQLNTAGRNPGLSLHGPGAGLTSYLCPYSPSQAPGSSSVERMDEWIISKSLSQLETRAQGC